MSADVWGDERRGWERLRPGSTRLVFSGSVLTLYTVDVGSCRMGCWFSMVFYWCSVMETAGRFASKPGCHSTFVRCMPNTRQGVCRARWLSRILCFRYILSWGQAVLRMLAYFWYEYNASKRPTFYVCLLLFSSQICLKAFASSSSASLLLEGGSPLPKFVFTSSLAVFGETYVEAGIPVGSGGMSLCT